MFSRLGKNGSRFNDFVVLFMYMVKRYFVEYLIYVVYHYSRAKREAEKHGIQRISTEYCISFSRDKISVAEAVIMCRIRNVKELKIKNKNWYPSRIMYVIQGE